MRNKEAKLVLGLSFSMLFGVMFLAFAAERNCCRIRQYHAMEKEYKNLSTTVKQQTQSFQKLLAQKDLFLNYKNIWRTYFERFSAPSAIWSEVSRLSVSKNLLNRLQEEHENSVAIEVDGNLEPLLDLVREVENHLPHVRITQIAFKPSVYGEANLTLKLQLPEITCY